MNHDWVGLSDLVQRASSPGMLHEQAGALQGFTEADCQWTRFQPWLHLLEPC